MDIPVSRRKITLTQKLVFNELTLKNIKTQCRKQAVPLCAAANGNQLDLHEARNC